jgi:hypothetical protein
VTRADLKAALSKTVGRKGMSGEALDDLTDYILSFFGFDTVIVDNRLSPSDRDVFYMLEEEGLLNTTQEEVTLRKGKVWRLHYWILKADHIKSFSNKEKCDDSAAPETCASVYETMGEEVWERKT